MFAPRLSILGFVASVVQILSFSAASNEMNARPTGLTGSYIAVNETRHAVEVNQTSISSRDLDGRPTWSKSVSWRGRRLRRDATTNVVEFGLNALGIVFSLIPGGQLAGAISSILAALVPMIFPDGNPTTAFLDIIWEQRALQQKLKLLGFKDTMIQIQAQARSGNDNIANSRILSLYDSLNSDRCLFMHTDNLRSSFTYFKEFATIHIVINQAMILLHPTELHWQRMLEKNVKEYVNYARFIIWKEADSGRIGIVEGLTPTIDAWTRQLPANRREVVSYSGAVGNDRVVSFKILSEGNYWRNYWLSCWWSGYRCVPESCPGEDNPMERGSQYQYNWHCRGQVFWIEGIDETNGIIRTCSRVGICYSHMRGQYWWLSHIYQDQVRTQSCPGESASSMRYGACGDEVWRIYVHGKPCGAPVQDRDVVSLLNHNGKAPLRQYNNYNNPNFIIFRSDVDRNQYRSDLPCA